MCSEANKDGPLDALSIELQLFCFNLFGSGFAGLGTGGLAGQGVGGGPGGEREGEGEAVVAAGGGVLQFGEVGDDGAVVVAASGDFEGAGFEEDAEIGDEIAAGDEVAAVGILGGGLGKEYPNTSWPASRFLCMWASIGTLATCWPDDLLQPRPDLTNQASRLPGANPSLTACARGFVKGWADSD